MAQALTNFGILVLIIGVLAIIARGVSLETALVRMQESVDRERLDKETALRPATYLKKHSRFHIVSDGTLLSTKIIDTKTGEMWQGVTAVKLDARVGEDPIYHAMVEMRCGFELAVDGQIKYAFLRNDGTLRYLEYPPAAWSQWFFEQLDKPEPKPERELTESEKWMLT